MINQSSERLQPLVEELKGYKTKKEITKKSVSQSNVAWQIDHSLKVINLVSKSFLESDPKEYRSRFNMWRSIFFTIGFFPRGKAKAPKMVQASNIITDESINKQLDLAFDNLEALKTANENAHFKHFMFGVLNKKRTIKFLQLHTTHHLKIIRDILKS